MLGHVDSWSVQCLARPVVHPTRESPATLHLQHMPCSCQHIIAGTHLPSCFDYAVNYQIPSITCAKQAHVNSVPGFKQLANKTPTLPWGAGPQSAPSFAICIFEP